MCAMVNWLAISVLSQLLIITIIYFILGVRSASLTFLVPMSANCRPPSHQSILYILHFSPFLTKCILLEMCLVCLVSLLLLAMHIADLPSKTIRGASYGNIFQTLEEVQDHTLSSIKVVQFTMAHMFQDQFLNPVQKVTLSAPVTDIPIAI